jgi:DNA-binding MarR family transcriptional regulator
MVGFAAQNAHEEEGRAALRTWLRMLSCTNMIDRRIRGKLRKQFRTTLPRFDVLAQLDSAEKHLGRGLTLSELSHRMMVTNGNITGLVDRLVREKLISRTVVPNDRRTQVVALTAAGRRSFSRMVPENREWVEDIFKTLSHDEHMALYELLGRLKEAVHRADHEENS